MGNESKGKKGTIIEYRDIRKNEEINGLIEKGNDVLKELGYTEHSKKHAAKVAERAGEILTRLGYDKREAELARIAGYMHDIETASTGITMLSTERFWHIRYLRIWICLCVTY